MIEKRLVLCAQILREYGDALLRGDFSQLGAQRATMYDDVPPRAPVITLWMPETSDHMQRETWAEEVRHQSPGIRVITRTYKPQLTAKRNAQAERGIDPRRQFQP